MGNVTASGVTVQTVSLRLHSVRFSRPSSCLDAPGSRSRGVEGSIITGPSPHRFGGTTAPSGFDSPAAGSCCQGEAWETRWRLAPRCPAAPSACALSGPCRSCRWRSPPAAVSPPRLHECGRRDIDRDPVVSCRPGHPAPSLVLTHRRLRGCGGHQPFLGAANARNTTGVLGGLRRGLRPIRGAANWTPLTRTERSARFHDVPGRTLDPGANLEPDRIDLLRGEGPHRRDQGRHLVAIWRPARSVLRQMSARPLAIGEPQPCPSPDLGPG
jgi:hypothetical protein